MEKFEEEKQPISPGLYIWNLWKYLLPSQSKKTLKRWNAKINENRQNNRILAKLHFFSWTGLKTTFSGTIYLTRKANPILEIKTEENHQFCKGILIQTKTREQVAPVIVSEQAPKTIEYSWEIKPISTGKRNNLRKEKALVWEHGFLYL